MMRAVLLAACLLAGSVQAQEGLPFGPAGGELEFPTRFIKFEAIGVGPGIMAGNYGSSLWSVRVAKVTYMSGRLRVGASFGDLYWVPGGLWPVGHMVAFTMPVHAGFTIWNDPDGSRFFYGSSPDVYLEASCSPWSLLGSEPAARVALSTDVDKYGFGVRVEAGVVGGLTTRQYGLYAAFQVRLLTFGIGF
jgi:hypothetical protein